ncbi:MAG: septation protein A [Alphaproteobacteria bacterium]|nr:septation protein A [Alphaproteobacteria bacterium]
MKAVIDYGPLAAFLVAYYAGGIMAATVAVMAATVVVLALAWFVERRVAVIALVTGVVVMVFGGLTLWFDDATFIKLKPTLVYLLFAVVLLVGVRLGKQPLKLVFGGVFHLTAAGWRGLTLRWAGFFLGMAALNEAIWRTQSDAFWVNFKVFGLIGLTIAFTLAQMPYMRRHAAPEER